jgi:hypothetical protein
MPCVHCEFNALADSRNLSVSRAVADTAQDHNTTRLGISGGHQNRPATGYEFDTG